MMIAVSSTGVLSVKLTYDSTFYEGRSKSFEPQYIRLKFFAIVYAPVKCTFLVYSCTRVEDVMSL